MEDDEVELVKVYTRENPIDTPMKVLLYDSFRKCVALMELVNKMELDETLKH